MRLIAAGRVGGVYHAGAEIKLPPGAITYWRTPGEAGVPPKFSVNGSENIADVKILFPAPERIDEQGIEAFGYRGGVVFPIHVVPQHQGQPVRLRLTVDYAVCDNICLPEESSAELVLPDDANGPSDPALAAAEARVPMALAPDEAKHLMSIVRDDGATDPTWLLTFKGDMVPTDLFAEAPEGWVFATQRRARGRFSIVAVEQGGARRVSVHLTLTGPQKAYEFTTELQMPAKAPPLESSKG